MNRFDDSFSGIDHSTGRPFSWGHPDGVWLIATLYSLPVMASVARVLLTLLFSEGGVASLSVMLPLIITTVMFVPPIVLLFARSMLAFVWTVLLALLYLIVGIGYAVKLNHDGELGIVALLMIGAVVFGQAFIAVYTYRMKRDALLR